MKMDLIIPICGESTRYPGELPKWAYSINGKTMLEMSIEGISGYNNIYIVYLKKHKHIISSLNLDKKNWNLIQLEEQTKSQPETIYKALQLIKCESFSVKDCDNYFEIDLINNNFITYYKLNDVEYINVKNKSYIEKDINSNLKAIFEKFVMSTEFCTGMYSFLNIDEYNKSFKKLTKFHNNIYMSHIISDMLLNNINFKCVKVKNYIDWGTIKDWREYVNNISQR